MNWSFITNPDDGKIAHAYQVFNDGRMSEDGLPLLKGEDAFGGSDSLKSCVNDIIIRCKVLIQAMRAEPSMNDIFEEACPPSVTIGSSHGLTKDSILKALRTATQPQFPLAKDSRQIYGLGLFSFHLPICEINKVTNGYASEIMNGYTLSADSSPIEVIGQGGDLESLTNAYWTFPETESAVIVMTNASSTYGYPSNILTQVLIQALFEMQPATDYEKLASGAVAKAKARWQEVLDAYGAERRVGTHRREVKAYVGIYESTDLRMTLKINAIGEVSLRLCINGLLLPDQSFNMYHYHFDT